MAKKQSTDKQLRLLGFHNELELSKFKKRTNLKKAGSPSRSGKTDLLIENLINVETTAEVLGVAPKTIRNWVFIRFIPYVKIGGRVLFRPKSLELWLNQKENKSWL